MNRIVLALVWLVDDGFVGVGVDVVGGVGVDVGGGVGVVVGGAG